MFVSFASCFYSFFHINFCFIKIKYEICLRKLFVHSSLCVEIPIEIGCLYYYRFVSLNKELWYENIQSTKKRKNTNMRVFVVHYALTELFLFSIWNFSRRLSNSRRWKVVVKMKERKKERIENITKVDVASSTVLLKLLEPKIAVGTWMIQQYLPWKCIP